MGDAEAPAAIIIDDNYDNCEIFRAILDQSGYNVSIYMEAQAALDALEETKFTLAVVDLQIPKITGVEIMERIKQNPLHKQMTIVVATANPHMVTEDVSLRADYVVYKPIAVTEFAQLIGRLKPTSWQ